MKTIDPLYSIVSCREGKAYEDISYLAIGRSGHDIREPEEDELSQVPYGTLSFYLPDRIPLGKHIKRSKIELISSSKDKLLAIGMIPPSGYTRTLMPAYKNISKDFLPFFSYSMGAYRNGEFFIAAVPIENSYRWDPSQYDSIDLEKKIKKRLKKSPGNRLLKHLAHCALFYNCYNAQNIFYGRWEGGIPVAPSCNADCLGCISKKREKNPQSPQKRISFIPAVEEIAEIAIEHLGTGQAIVSFGQGCEGDPLLQAQLIKEAIIKIRQHTNKGTIHLNTNGSIPKNVEKLIDAGLDSIRISMNSAIEEHYNIFYRPSGYNFAMVKDTMRIAKARGAFLSINLLILPGISDSDRELEALFSLLHKYKPHMLQLRNLNIDPDLYFQKMPAAVGKKIGIPKMIRLLREKFPWMKVGNFSPPLRD